MDNDVKKAIETLTRLGASCASGDKHLCVLDRGWIFEGNLTRDDKGICTLTDVVNVRKWTQGGFGALALGAVRAGAVLDPCAPIRFREDAMIFAVPTGDGWRNA